MAVLHAVGGPLKGQRFAIPDRPRLIVGRYEVHDVILPDASISRKHFALEKRDDGMYLVDLGSLNGTQLNGRRVSTAKLETGDKILAGQSILYFDYADSQAPPAEALEEHEGEVIELLDDEDIIEVPPDSVLQGASAHATLAMPAGAASGDIPLPIDDVEEAPPEVEDEGAQDAEQTTDRPGRRAKSSRFAGGGYLTPSKEATLRSKGTKTRLVRRSGRHEEADGGPDRRDRDRQRRGRSSRH